MTADQLIAHFQEQWQVYLAILVVASPVIYVTRQYSIPAMLWTAEVAVYSAGFHIVMAGLVRLTRWFRTESQMELPQDRVDPGWTTPVIEFWRPELYVPQWIFYVEIAAVIFFFGLVIKMRPIKPQRIIPKAPPRRPGQPGGYRPGQRGPGPR